MARTIKIVDTFSGGTVEEYQVGENITWKEVCDKYPELEGKRAKVGNTWSGGKQWVLSPNDTLPNDDGVTIYIIETRTKAGN